MKNTKRILLFSPYLDTFGGGEKHYLSIIEVLDKLGFKTDLLWPDKSILSKLKSSLGLSFDNVSVKEHFLERKNFFSKLKEINKYDILIYITDGSYFFSAAKKNYIFAMVPEKKLYSLSTFNRLKLHNFHFITNSKFTQKNLNNWGIKSRVLYPYINDAFFIKESLEKEKIILCVGRFFSHLHSKKQGEVIDSFIKNKQKNILFKDFKLYIVGRLKSEDKFFYEQLQIKVQKRQDILLLPNLSNDQLLLLYKKALFFWHFAGLNIDERQNPEQVEHLGIAPLEAMASGCIVFAYKAGGISEIINDGNTGFTFQREEELDRKMKVMLQENEKMKLVQKNAAAFIRENFSYEVFYKNVLDIFKL